MSHEELQAIWFVLWGVIWTAYFIFDSFTLGNGMLFPFVTKDLDDRKQLQEIVGPFWNGAEVWLLLAGGATLAAFPIVYADMFSMLYVPLFLLLFSLIFRAVGLELMHKDKNPIWQSVCKWAHCVCSFLIPFILGVFFSNLFLGLPIDESGIHMKLSELFSTYAIIGGLLFVCLFITIGSAWMHLKAEGPVVERSYKIAMFTAPSTAALLSIYYLATWNRTPLYENFNENSILYLIPLLSLATGIAAVLLFWKKKMGVAFALFLTTIALTFTTMFTGMFPNMLPSSISDEFTLTCFNSSSSELTLTIMLIVAIIMVPIVIGYQVWAHILFRDKIKRGNARGY